MNRRILGFVAPLALLLNACGADDVEAPSPNADDATADVARDGSYDAPPADTRQDGPGSDGAGPTVETGRAADAALTSDGEAPDAHAGSDVGGQDTLADATSEATADVVVDHDATRLDASASDSTTIDVGDSSIDSHQPAADGADTHVSTEADVDTPDALVQGDAATDVTAHTDSATLDADGGDEAEVGHDAGPVTLTVTPSTVSGFIDQELSAVRACTSRAGSPLVGADITVVPPAGGAAEPSVGVTDSSGCFTFKPRLARNVGEQSFTIHHAQAEEVSVGATARPPTNGHIFSLVNAVDRTTFTGVPGSGTVTGIRSPEGLAVASDGTVYFSEASCRILALDPRGVLSIVAGTGTCASGAATGAAAEVALNGPRGLALDEANHLLFVAERSGHRVRAIDLASRTISTYAGNGTTGGSDIGDGGQATLAVVDEPMHVWVGPPPARDVYVSEIGPDYGRMRKITRSTHVIQTWLSPSRTNCGLADLQLWGCSGGSRDQRGWCSLAFGPGGSIYVGAWLCGQETGATSNSYPAYGIVRVDEAGTVVAHVAGCTGYESSCHSSVTEEHLARSTRITAFTYLATAPNGDLAVVERAADRIVRIAASDNRLYLLAGEGAFSNDYRAARGAYIDFPTQAAFDPQGNLVFGDLYRGRVRAVWAP